MDIQTRKIEFIQEFLKLQSEESLSRFEKLLQNEKLTPNSNFEPMTVSELENRIEQSMDDSRNNKVTTSSDLVKEIEKWD